MGENMQTVSIGKYTLCYDYSTTYSPRLRLARILDDTNKEVMMSMYQEGNGIDIKKNFLGGPGYTGVMVRISNTKILVPYYLSFELEENNG